MANSDYIGNIRGPIGADGPQGLPGTNATPADAAVAGYISTAGTSDTKTALQAGYTLRRDFTVDIAQAAPGVDLTGAVAGNTQLTTLLDSLPSGAKVIIPPGAIIRLEAAVVLTKPVHFDGRGSKFNVIGTVSGFEIPAAASGSSFRDVRMQGFNPTTYAAANKAFNFTGIPAAWVDGVQFENVSCDGFGYGGFFGSHLKNSSFRNCKVTNSVYCGFQFLSPLNVTLWNPTIDTLQGLLANNYMQSYPIAWTRDATQASIVNYPNAENCTTWGGLIQNTGWEGVDTHGGRNIRTIGTDIFGCFVGVAYVPCANNSGVDTWAPVNCLVAFCNIDSKVSDDSKGVGIKLIGAGGATARVEAASGQIIGNKIKGHGRGTNTIDGTADPSFVGGGIQLYQTNAVKISDNEIIEPNPFGVALWYDNTACQIGANTVTDAWSASASVNAGAVGIRSTGNDISVGAVKLLRASKSATNVNKTGILISSNTTNTVNLTGGDELRLAETPFSGGNSGVVRAITNGIEIGVGTAAPTLGVWSRGAQWINSAATAGGSPGWVCTTAGGVTSVVWAATTAYAAGQWVRTSTGKVLECVTAGTSSATQPDPTTVGANVTDGSVVWAYRAATGAVFKTMANLGA